MVSQIFNSSGTLKNVQWLVEIGQVTLQSLGRNVMTYKSRD